MLIDLLGISIIVGVTGLGASVLGMQSIGATSAILLIVGCSVSLLLNFGRRRSNVLAGLAAGMVVKMLGITAIYFFARHNQVNPSPLLLFALFVLFLFYIWTTYRFHISSLSPV